MGYVTVSSKNNEFFKNIKKLKMKKYRDEECVFLAEGLKFLDLDVKPETIILREGTEISKEYDDKFSGVKKFIMNEILFKEISSQENSQGIIIVYNKPKTKIENIGKFVLVLDEIQDPGNIGTIIRTMDAAGLKDLIIIKGSADIYSEKVIRSTMGSIFSVNSIYMEKEECLEFLKKENYTIISTALEKDSLIYNKAELRNIKTVVVFGNEGNGVSREFIENSDYKIMIPIYGKAESLNVAVACGIILYKFKEMNLI